MYYPEQKVVVLGINDNLVEFYFEKMKIKKNLRTKKWVFYIEKVNDETFLTGEYFGNLKLINKKDLTSLSHLQLE